MVRKYPEFIESINTAIICNIDQGPTFSPLIETVDCRRVGGSP